MVIVYRASVRARLSLLINEGGVLGSARVREGREMTPPLTLSLSLAHPHTHTDTHAHITASTHTHTHAPTHPRTHASDPLTFLLLLPSSTFLSHWPFLSLAARAMAARRSAFSFSLSTTAGDDDEDEKTEAGLTVFPAGILLFLACFRENVTTIGLPMASTT